jgi:hypothetical protein
MRKKDEVFVSLDADSREWSVIVKMRGNDPVIKGVRMKAHKFLQERKIYLQMLNYRRILISPDKSECFVYFTVSDVELGMATIMASSEKYLQMKKLSRKKST